MLAFLKVSKHEICTKYVFIVQKVHLTAIKDIIVGVSPSPSTLTASLKGITTLPPPKNTGLALKLQTSISLSYILLYVVVPITRRVTLHPHIRAHISRYQNRTEGDAEEILYQTWICV